MKASEERAMKRGGDDRAGFEIQIEPGQRLMVLRAWGLWSMPLAHECNRALFDSYKELGARGSPWYFLADHSRFPAQAAEIQAEISTTVRDAVKHGMKRSASVLGSTVTKLQIRRLTSASGLPMDVFAFFTLEEQALKWLLKT
ncbi:MAG: hypothetical protein ACMG6S_07790 [Byssovorax sp.]